MSKEDKGRKRGSGAGGRKREETVKYGQNPRSFKEFFFLQRKQTKGKNEGWNEGRIKERKLKICRG